MFCGEKFRSKRSLKTILVGVGIRSMSIAIDVEIQTAFKARNEEFFLE